VRGHWPVVAVIVFWSMVLTASTCIEPKPLQVRQLCGRVVDPAGGVIPGVELQLIDSQKNVVASAEADDQGTFAFSQLQEGNYRLTTKTREAGFKDVYWPIRETRPTNSGQDCKRPLYVQLAPWSCGGSVSQKGYRP
jgi:hypothetical protein